MTKSTKAVTRETDATIRRRAIIVTIEPRVITLRLKGTRKDRFAITVDDLFDLLEWRAAKALMREKQQAKREAKRAGRRR